MSIALGSKQNLANLGKITIKVCCQNMVYRHLSYMQLILDEPLNSISDGFPISHFPQKTTWLNVQMTRCSQKQKNDFQDALLN